MSLPNGWHAFPLSDLTQKIGSGATPKGGKTSYQRSGTPLIRSMNIHFSGFTDEGLAYLDEAQAKQLQNVAVLPNDILLNITGASIGRVSIAPERMKGARVNQHVAIIRLVDGIEPKFILGFLSSRQMQEKINQENYGVTRQALTKSMIEEFSIPLAPQFEQRQIVAKIDSLSAKSRRARDQLDRVPRLVRKYKQAILGAACTGKLTQDLKRKRGWADWTFEPARDVCAKVQSGGTPKEGFERTGIPFLKVYNIVDQKIAFEYRPQYVNRSVHNGALAKSKAFPDDVLMNIVGPPLGKVAIIPGDQQEWNINQALTLFRPSERLTSKWIYYYLCSGKSVDEVANDTKGSAGQVNISLSQCRDFVFPVPSVDEQFEIVRRIEVAFSWIDHLSSEATSARTLIDHLDEAILTKAFRGELVPQDSNNEPAAVLVGRLKEGRHSNAVARRKRGSQRRPA